MNYDFFNELPIDIITVKKEGEWGGKVTHQVRQRLQIGLYKGLDTSHIYSTNYNKFFTPDSNVLYSPPI